MGTFKKGTLGEILDGVAFKKDNIFGGDNLNHPNSFAVQVTYYEADGTAHKADAVMTYTGNTRTCYGGQGSFNLTMSDGTQIPYSALYNPDTLVTGNESLDEFIKVYDVPDDQFGNATPENLNDQVKTASKTTDGTTTNDKGDQDTRPKKSGVGPSGGETSPFSIENVIGGSYPHTAELLYKEYLKNSEAGTFESYSTSISEDCSSVITLTETIEGTLAASNSEAFYSGPSATPNVTNLQTAAENANTLKSAVESVSSEDVGGIVTQYNEALKSAKAKVKRELLVTAAEEFNSKNLVESTSSKKEYTMGYQRAEETEKFDSKRHYRIVTSKTESRDENNTDEWSRTVTETKYKYIDINAPLATSTIEANFKFHSADLPYDKSKVVE